MQMPSLKSSFLLAALALMTTGPVMAFQQSDSPDLDVPKVKVPDAVQRKAEGPPTVVGEIVSMNGNEITIRNQEIGNESFRIPERVNVLLNGKAADLNDLKNGDMVQIAKGTGGKAVRIVASRNAGVRKRPALERNPVPRNSSTRSVQTDSPNDPDNDAWLGLMLRKDENAKALEVVRIFPSGPAARAGVVPGDYLLEIGDHTIASQEDITEALADSKPGESVKLTVRRANKNATLTTKVDDRRDYLPPRRNAQEFKREQQAEDWNADLTDHAMMLEQHRRFAEQHQRIEEKLDRVLKELEELRRQMGVARNRNGAFNQTQDVNEEVKEEAIDEVSDAVDEPKTARGSRDRAE